MGMARSGMQKISTEEGPVVSMASVFIVAIVVIKGQKMRA